MARFQAENQMRVFFKINLFYLLNTHENLSDQMLSKFITYLTNHSLTSTLDLDIGKLPHFFSKSIKFKDDSPHHQERELQYNISLYLSQQQQTE